MAKSCSPPGIFIVIKVTEEFIHQGKSGVGGWCAAQLRLIGVKWPPSAGWIERTAGRNIELTDEAARLFLGYGGGSVSKAMIRKHNRKGT
jgi:CRISPR/Cas system-associated protein Csx1